VSRAASSRELTYRPAKYGILLSKFADKQDGRGSEPPRSLINCVAALSYGPLFPTMFKPVSPIATAIATAWLDTHPNPDDGMAPIRRILQQYRAFNTSLHKPRVKVPNQLQNHATVQTTPFSTRLSKGTSISRTDVK
jgi:hypothetical protein